MSFHIQGSELRSVCVFGAREKLSLTARVSEKDLKRNINDGDAPGVWRNVILKARTFLRDRWSGVVGCKSNQPTNGNDAES